MFRRGSDGQFQLCDPHRCALASASVQSPSNAPTASTSLISVASQTTTTNGPPDISPARTEADATTQAIKRKRHINDNGSPGQPSPTATKSGPDSPTAQVTVLTEGDITSTHEPGYVPAVDHSASISIPAITHNQSEEAAAMLHVPTPCRPAVLHEDYLFHISPRSKTIFDRWREECASLKHRINSSAYVNQLVKIPPKQPIALDIDALRQSLTDISVAINGVVAFSDGVELTCFEGTYFEGQLGMLAARALGEGWMQYLKDSLGEPCQYTTLALIRTLCAGALCLWVFEAEYPVFDGHKLMETYRARLASDDLPHVLRVVDYAAHDDILRSRTFIQCELDPYAITLAKRFVCPLDVCLFKKALELKVQLVLTTDEFEAFMPLPEDAFDATCMELSRQAPLREAELREAAEVDKCSMPAFYKLQRNAEESALVQYKKFRWTDAETRGKVELLRKAVVLAE
ncbi:hypothetical protein LTS18_007726 [Coniosporium uncinatum]|uniref:Uncharacterized protein n=1 Tax=Coniosporium uncinatum TaxID=93489 RepID=A0ACC3D2B6_9PEZI|nr:hypothetical protein LTS18_007726 [Coniosporium uncinatum]